MRKEGAFAQGIYIFLKEKLYRNNKANYQYSDVYWFEEATNDTILIIKQAKERLKNIFKQN